MGDDRLTKVLEIGTNKILVKTYITALEAREIYSFVWQQLDDGQKDDKKTARQKTSLDLQDKQIETIVININGKTDNIVKQALDLPVQEFAILADYIKEVMGEKKSLSENSPNTSPAG